MKGIVMCGPKSAKVKLTPILQRVLEKITRYTLAAVVIAASLLLVACGLTEVLETVESTVPPESVEVTKEVGLQVEGTSESKGGPGTGCSFNAYRAGWVMDYSDAGNILNDVFHPDSPFQHTSWDEETFRNLVDQAVVELAPDVRATLWQKAENILLTEYAAVIPIFYYDLNSLVQPGIEYEFPPFGQAHYIKWTLPEGQTTLRVHLEGEPLTLDVNTASDTTSYKVLNQLMEGLYRYTGDGTIEPAGAESYDVSEDGLVYTIYLREDAAWSDGEPVIAQHYVDGITRLMLPETAAHYAWLMYVIQGAQVFSTGETDDSSILGVRAIDDYTLEIALEQAASYFDSILAFSTTYPVRLDVIEQCGSQWTEPGNFVGNGAYVLVEWEHENHLIIEKNPSYWDADNVTIERVEFPIITETATALAAYEQGELDVSRYPPEELTRVLEEMPEHLVRLPWPGTYYIGLNTLRSPTDNLNVRKALASAVDKRVIVDDVLGMPWRIEACGVVPPEIPGYQGCGYVGYEFDVTVAQGYLQAAMANMDSIHKTEDITIDLWCNDGSAHVVEAVAKQWENNLGINVNVIKMAWDDYLNALEMCGN
jgi:oligopeptide transport system substrate-binding protein